MESIFSLVGHVPEQFETAVALVDGVLGAQQGVQSDLLHALLDGRPLRNRAVLSLLQPL